MNRRFRHASDQDRGRSWRDDRKIRVGSIPFQISSLPQAAHWTCSQALKNRTVKRGKSVRLANAYCVALAEKDPRYANLVAHHGVTFPDGMPVLWAMRWAARGTSLRPERVRGPSFFDQTLSQGVSHGIRHYFVGTTESTLDRLQDTIRRQYPDIIVAGACAPPFAPVTDAWADDIAAEIRRVGPDLVWVALGTPKQDFASELLAQRTGLLCIGVGAAFDFKAGTVPEAPRWMQNTGLEWIFRLVSEPRRLWRRYLIGNVQFLAAAGRHASRSRSSAIAALGIDLRHVDGSHSLSSIELTTDPAAEVKRNGENSKPGSND